MLRVQITIQTGADGYHFICHIFFFFLWGVDKIDTI